MSLEVNLPAWRFEAALPAQDGVHIGSTTTVPAAAADAAAVPAAHSAASADDDGSDDGGHDGDSVGETLRVTFPGEFAALDAADLEAFKRQVCLAMCGTGAITAAHISGVVLSAGSIIASVSLLARPAFLPPSSSNLPIGD